MKSFAIMAALLAVGTAFGSYIGTTLTLAQMQPVVAVHVCEELAADGIATRNVAVVLRR